MKRITFSKNQKNIWRKKMELFELIQTARKSEGTVKTNKMKWRCSNDEVVESGKWNSKYVVNGAIVKRIGIFLSSTAASSMAKRIASYILFGILPEHTCIAWAQHKMYRRTIRATNSGRNNNPVGNTNAKWQRGEKKNWKQKHCGAFKLCVWSL